MKRVSHGQFLATNLSARLRLAKQPIYQLLGACSALTATKQKTYVSFVALGLSIPNCHAIEGQYYDPLTCATCAGLAK
jgi:hypothetical protein